MHPGTLPVFYSADAKADCRYKLEPSRSQQTKIYLPGLAQLVERLAHRYSESKSLNPGNLTSATVCGDRTGCMPAAKRLASVAPEVYLGEYTLHSPLQKANKAESTLALEPREDFIRNPKQGYQWPQKRTCVSAEKLFKKKEKKIYLKPLPLPSGNVLCSLSLFNP